MKVLQKLVKMAQFVFSPIVGALAVLLVAQVQACGYETCPRTDGNKLNIHMIPHSHDDVGWLKTPDGYFDEDVQNVFNSVLKALSANSNRRFVQVEMYYFTRWWQYQTDDVRNKVKQFVEKGQLAFANGGWCLNDEASAHYSSIIDQMTLGNKFIRSTFGECAVPTNSWQIDPFGPSREQAHLFALMDFKGHVLNRGYNLHGEFMWNTSDNGELLFSTVLHNHYSAPGGFNFEDCKNLM